VGAGRSGRVVADFREGTGFQIDASPSRTIIVIGPATDDVPGAIRERVRAAGFTNVGSTTWERRRGGFVDVTVTSTTSPSVNVFGHVVTVPPEREAVIVRFTT
jgi:hypothetical protein